MTRYPKQHGRRIGIFQTDTTAFLESRGLGLISVIVRISFLFILLFTILNSSFSSLSFVQLSVASLLIVAMCMVLIVLNFTNVSTKTLVDFLQNDCDCIEKGCTIIYIFVHPNKQSHFLEEYRSRYSKFRTNQCSLHALRTIIVYLGFPTVQHWREMLA